MKTFPLNPLLVCMVSVTLLAACSDSDDNTTVADDENPATLNQPFVLDFVATDGEALISCGDVVENLGIGGQSSIELADLRFYVSDLMLLDSNGDVVEYRLDDDEFHHADDSGEVSLVDLTDNSAGACSTEGDSPISGTARMNSQISGLAASDDIAAVDFSVGVPQGLMQSIIGSNTAEGTPSPLNEMYWSWASGYRHLLLNFEIAHSDGSTGGGFLHVGSRGCTGADGENALESRDTCEFVNNPAVSLSGLTADSTIALDVRALLADVDMLVNVVDPETREPVLDENGAEVMMAGVTCHSAPVAMQPDCGAVFANLGLNPDDGSADASMNAVFSIRQ